MTAGSHWTHQPDSISIHPNRWTVFSTTWKKKPWVTFFSLSLIPLQRSQRTRRILKEAAGSWTAVHLIVILTRHYKNNPANKLGAGLGRGSPRPHVLHPAQLFISRGPQKNPSQSNMTNTLSQSHTGQIHLLYCYSPHHHPPAHPSLLSLSLSHFLSICSAHLKPMSPTHYFYLHSNAVSPRVTRALGWAAAICLRSGLGWQLLLSPAFQEINLRSIERCCVETRV